MQKEKFIVLDVEGQSTCRPYNIGFIVADRYGKIYKSYSYAFPECIWENIVETVEKRVAIGMSKKNIQEILGDFKNRRLKRKYKQISINEFYNKFIKIIKHYKIKRFFAYNVTFDKNALKRLFGEERFSTLNLEYCDIITGILKTKLLTKKYCNFCIENGYITKNNNIQTKAEIVYRYITNCINFVEEHTGLADVQIEYQILLTAFNSHKKISFEPCQAWRILKNFCEDNKIILQ